VGQRLGYPLRYFKKMSTSENTAETGIDPEEELKERFNQQWLLAPPKPLTERLGRQFFLDLPKGPGV